MSNHTMTKSDATIVLIMHALIEALKAAGRDGVPAGLLYAGVMGTLTLAQFQAVMATMVDAGVMRKHGDVYYYVG